MNRVRRRMFSLAKHDEKVYWRSSYDEVARPSVKTYSEAHLAVPVVCSRVYDIIVLYDDCSYWAVSFDTSSARSRFVHLGRGPKAMWSIRFNTLRSISGQTF